MSQTSLMRKLTYAAITGFILFALCFVFVTGLVTATNGIALAEGSPKAIFPQPYFEILISLAIGFIPLADVIWQHTKDSETQAQAQQSSQNVAAFSSMISNVMSNVVETLKELKKDKTATARLPHGRYDPDPRRRSHRHKGHRKGVEPAGLRRWRLVHRRTHDPGYRRSLSMGPRGGHYFRGPKKRRYDPAPRRSRARAYFARHPRYHRAGSKVGGLFNRWGTALGALIGGAIGIGIGYNDYNTAFGPNAAQDYLNTIIGGPIKNSTGTLVETKIPEIAHLWTTAGGWDPLSYVKFKFLGLKNDTYQGSAWVYPFWIGLIATLAAPVARLFTSKGQRFLRPLSKVGHGMLAVSTVGALALPGCPKTVDMVKTPNGSYAQTPQTNQKIGGAF